MPFLTRWNNEFSFGNIDRSFSALDEIRRRMERAFDEVASDPSSGLNGPSSWPPTNLSDSGSELVLRAEVPGVAEGDIDVQLNQDVLTISGERKTQVPEGYSAHRRERGGLRFSRSYSLPFKVDADTCEATLAHGVLTVKVGKAPEAQPRRITVKGN